MKLMWYTYVINITQTILYSGIGHSSQNCFSSKASVGLNFIGLQVLHLPSLKTKERARSQKHLCLYPWLLFLLILIYAQMITSLEGMFELDHALVYIMGNCSSRLASTSPHPRRGCGNLLIYSH